jgi:hypothetical protein
MTTKIFTLAMIGWFLAATGCGVPDDTPAPDPGKAPPPIANTVAGGVLVVFGNVGTQATPQYCPVSVARTDNECDLGKFVGSGKSADYVCRYPEDEPEKSMHQRQVFWSGATSTNGNPQSLLFSIEFKNNLNPCQNALPPNPAATKICNAKKRGDMTFSETPPEAVFEYGVTAPGCETLDPYIVFR